MKSKAQTLHFHTDPLIHNFLYVKFWLFSNLNISEQRPRSYFESVRVCVCGGGGGEARFTAHSHYSAGAFSEFLGRGGLQKNPPPVL